MTKVLTVMNFGLLSHLKSKSYASSSAKVMMSLYSWIFLHRHLITVAVTSSLQTIALTTPASQVVMHSEARKTHDLMDINILLEDDKANYK